MKDDPASTNDGRAAVTVNANPVVDYDVMFTLDGVWMYVPTGKSYYVPLHQNHDSDQDNAGKENASSSSRAPCLPVRRERSRSPHRTS